MRIKRLVMGVVICGLFLTMNTGTVQAAEGWEVNFDDGAIGGGNTCFVIRGKGGDSSRLIEEVKDGVFYLGGKFDAESSKRGDYASINWPNIGGSYSITDFPVLEIKYWHSKDAGIRIFLEYQLEDGSRCSPYFNVPMSKGEGWNTVKIPLAGGDSRFRSFPKNQTSAKLLRVSIWLQASTPTPGERIMKLDWIKLVRTDPFI